MIDWAGVGQGALWVLGLATVLAACSRAHWLSGQQRVRFRTVLGSPVLQMACDAGLALLCAGLFFSARALWERTAWVALGTLYVALAVSEHNRSIAPCRPCPAMRGGRLPYGRLATWVNRLELWCALGAVPLLVFPGRWSPWALGGVAALWALRWATTGRLTVRTPVDGSLLVLWLLLPLTWWASADHAVTLPALYQLLASLLLCHSVVNWAVTPQRLWTAAGVLALCGAGLALLAPLSATTWPTFKLFNALPVLSRLKPLLKPFWGEQINANVLGGGLALIGPVAAALLALRVPGSAWRAALARLGWGMVLLAITAVLVLSQARASLLAVGLAALGMALWRWRPLRWLALCAGAALLVWMTQRGLPDARRWVELLSSTGTLTSLAGRQEVWSRALYMLEDFPFTGIGLGTFDLVQPLLYPFFLSAGLAHHAHNLFLQVAVDLGLPGLIAYLALLLGTAFATWRSLTRAPLSSRAQWPAEGLLALGLLGSQAVLVLQGLLDVATWGTKLSFLPWFVRGLSLALGNLATDYADRSSLICYRDERRLKGEE
jgi:putative inorganic carbon (HCO3(-)) transporter